MNPDITTVSIPLSKLDSCIDGCGISSFWIVDCPGDSFSVPILEAALSRTIDKWRVFAGRLRRETVAGSKWHLLVPVGPIPADYALFTSSTSTISKSLSYPHLGSKDAEIISPLPESYFRPKNSPSSNVEYSETNSPIIGLKITKFLDSVVVGISFPHGVCDGVSMNSFVGALASDLRGEDFKAPALQESTNLVQKQLERILETGKVDGDPSTIQYEEAWKNSEKMTWYSGLKFFLSLKWEFFWHKAEERTLFLGKEVIRDLVATAKAEVKALGDGSFISTNDILMAWMLQTICKAQPKVAHDVSVVSAISIQSVLTPASDPKLLYRYAHVTTMLSTYPTLTLQQLIGNSIGTTSLIYRKSLTASQCTNYVIDCLKFFDKFDLQIPRTVRNQLRFGFTNQSFKSGITFPFERCVTSSGETEHTFGRIMGQLTAAFPYKVDHFMTITEQNGIDVTDGGNFYINGILRAKFWKALEQEIQRMKKIV